MNCVIGKANKGISYQKYKLRTEYLKKNNHKDAAQILPYTWHDNALFLADQKSNLFMLHSFSMMILVTQKWHSLHVRIDQVEQPLRMIEF